MAKGAPRPIVAGKDPIGALQSERLNLRIRDSANPWPSAINCDLCIIKRKALVPQ
jgi:hypothetical protein